MKPSDVKTSTCIGFEVKNNDKYCKFKVGNRVRKSKYKKVSAKGYTPNWSEKVFEWTYLIRDLMVKKLMECFIVKKNCKRQIK